MECLAQWVKDQARTDIPGGGPFADADFDFRQVSSGFAALVMSYFASATLVLDAACRHQQGIPHQSASLDCGMFVIMYARHLVTQQDMLFDQQLMPLLREKLKDFLLGQRTGGA